MTRAVLNYESKSKNLVNTNLIAKFLSQSYTSKIHFQVVLEHSSYIVVYHTQHKSPAKVKSNEGPIYIFFSPRPFL